MTVYDSHDIRSCSVDFAMDELFKIRPWALRVDWRTIELELKDVVRCDVARRHVAGQQEAIRALVVANADVAEGIDDAVIVEYVIGDDEIADQSWISGHDGFQLAGATMPAALAISALRVDSNAMKLAKAAAVSVTGSAPNAVSF